MRVVTAVATAALAERMEFIARGLRASIGQPLNEYPKEGR